MDEAKIKIEALIKKYEEAVSSGRVQAYTEQDTKHSFIAPLFEALGWDITNRNEVSAEESQISGGRVDYGFHLNSRPVLYVEAKPLRADLNREEYAWQAMRYSWNKGVDYAVLTDFESIKVFSSQLIEGALADRLIFQIDYKNYLEDFDRLQLLSKQSFLDKGLDKYADKYSKRLQKVSVGDKLYKDIQECRLLLTKSFKIHNDNLSTDLIDEGVQKLLDRLVFLRVAEDRGLEPPILKELVRGWKSNEKREDLYQGMVSKFRELNEFYNSNLFSEHPFEKWEEHDEATEEVIDILYGKHGYYEYDFKFIPADILGGVYENYLSYRLEESKKGVSVAKDAKKRKEQGIYYTPDFIVDYIVKNALGPVLEKCQSIYDLQKIKVLDPACGSGSFLVKAVELIAEKYKDFNAPDNTRTRLQILIQNIYGVDLDEKAVDIARLNLLISVLKDKEKLPSLSNIKNGNSLISGTDEELKKYFGSNFKDKKPFNWREKFPEVFKQGGFDVIIGNPPYIFARGGNFDENEKEYYYANYKLQQYQINTFSLFIELGFNLLKKNGDFGYIIPNNWLTINSFSKLREFLLKNTADLRIINTVESIFNKASVDTCLLLFRKADSTDIEVGDILVGENPILSKHKLEDFYQNEFVINISQTKNKQDSLELKNTVLLGEIAEVSTGLKAYQIGKGNPIQDEKIKKERRFHSGKKENDTFRPYLQGVDVKRYLLDWSGEYLSYGNWLAEPRKSVPFSGQRILVRQIPSPLPYCVNAVFIDDEYLNDINSMVIFSPLKEFNLKYILAILNSKLISQWFAKTFDKFQRKIFPQFKVNELARFPIYKATTDQQKQIIILVDNILLLNKELHEVEKNSNEYNKIKSEIEKTDKKIDVEVYKLYGLTEEEIKIVKGVN
ncbi:MAG: N-6 DNA methylase [bacterium]|nr:N-6 DNA methylase [bacterium]